MIEDLLTRTVTEPVDDWDASVHPSPLRFRYAINHIFARIAWDADLTLLETFVRAVTKDRGSHTFINFNYDLFVDRVIGTSIPSWHWHCGYGVPMAFALTVDPG